MTAHIGLTVGILLQNKDMSLIMYNTLLIPKQEIKPMR